MKPAKRRYYQRRYPAGVVSLQCLKAGNWKSLIGPDSTFSATGPQVDASGNPISGGLPSITSRGLWAGGAWTQMLQNSIFAGAVSGTPGTAPTNWSRFVPVGTTSLTVNGRSLTFNASAGRDYFYQTVNVLANTKYYLEADAICDGIQKVADLIMAYPGPADYTYQWTIDGIVQASGNSIVPSGNHKIGVISTIAGTAGTLQIRCGLSMSSASVTGTVTISNPQVSANYQYPYAASGPGQTVTVPASSATTGGNGTNTLNSKEMLEALRGKTDGVEKWIPTYALTLMQDNNDGSFTSLGGGTGIVAKANISTIGYRYLVKFKVTGYTSGTVGIGSGYVSGGMYVNANGSFELEATATNTGLGLVATVAGVTFSDISIQRLLPSVFTAVALVYVGAGSGEPSAASQDINIFAIADDAGIKGLKMVAGSVLANRQYCRANDGTTSINLGSSQDWNRDEIHLKVVQTNAGGTQFLVGNRRYTAAMVPIGALTWGSWAAYDGSMNPLTHLRLALNGTIPLWFRLVSLSNKSLTDRQILNQVRYVR